MLNMEDKVKRDMKMSEGEHNYPTQRFNFLAKTEIPQA